jgi:NSS family neurotransmitter:Na+ symporter
LPLGGMLIAIFAGWMMKVKHSKGELGIGNETGYQVWLFVIKFVAPVLVFIVILNLFGVVG